MNNKDVTGGLFKNIETNIIGTMEDHFNIILNETTTKFKSMDIKYTPTELLNAVAKQLNNMLSLGILKLIGYRNNELDIYTDDLPKECSND